MFRNAPKDMGRADVRAHNASLKAARSNDLNRWMSLNGYSLPRPDVPKKKADWTAADNKAWKAYADERSNFQGMMEHEARQETFYDVPSRATRAAHAVGGAVAGLPGAGLHALETIQDQGFGGAIGHGLAGVGHGIADTASSVASNAWDAVKATPGNMAHAVGRAPAAVERFATHPVRTLAGDGVKRMARTLTTVGTASLLTPAANLALIAVPAGLALGKINSMAGRHVASHRDNVIDGDAKGGRHADK